MVFTLITITLLSLFVVSYGAYSLVQDRSSVNKRINTLNNFVSSTEQDLPRQLFISGYRSVFLFDKKILDTGSYIWDVNASLNEIFFNGTLDGVYQDLMEDATFSAMQNFLTGNANKINADIQLLNPIISITQEDPWNLKIALNITLIIEDRGGLVKWNRSEQIVNYIPIENFEDPVYAVNTQNKVSNKVNRTPYSVFVSGADYTNLISHFENSYYRASASGPSFLNRLQGDLSADQNGIESLVYPQDLISQGISVKYKSVVDYIYFSSENPQAYSVPAVNNLILDDEDNHLEIYNVSGVAVAI
ncbi:MAG: hypothetical protein OEL89_01240 [Candidatus Peregrinibacteria bacterium]|nr:hypothetical protein [Candidatus Peregrinibacteria bacterium]